MGVAITAVATGFVVANRDSTEPEQVVGGATVSPAVLAVVRQFVRTAVARHNTVRSYDLVHPEMRGSLTRRQWASGNIPVVNYPVDGDITVEPRYVEPNEVLLEVGLTPTPGRGLAPLAFLIGLKRVLSGDASRWLVFYWVPSYETP